MDSRALMFLEEMGLNWDGIEVLFVKDPRQVVKVPGIHLVEPSPSELANAVCQAIEHDLNAIFIYSKHTMI